MTSVASTKVCPSARLLYLLWAYIMYMCISVTGMLFFFSGNGVKAWMPAYWGAASLKQYAGICIYYKYTLCWVMQFFITLVKTRMYALHYWNMSVWLLVSGLFITTFDMLMDMHFSLKWCCWYPLYEIWFTLQIQWQLYIEFTIPCIVKPGSGFWPALVVHPFCL